MNARTALVLNLLNSLVECAVIVSKTDDTFLNDFSIPDYVTKFGYPVEVHQNIQTEDGYLLEIHRIPYGRKNDTKTKRPPVFIMHGMTASADCWVVTGPRNGLAFILADRGYDVWLGNARGTSHCQKHVNLNHNSSKFWDFSWHEIGYYDVPASLNYIMTVTNQSKLIYIGHSQGGSTYFVATSTRPELNEHIKLFVGLAPGVFYGIEHIALPQKDASNIFGSLETVRRLSGINEVGSQLRRLVCDQPYSTPEICQLGILLTAFGAGLDPTQLNISMINEIQKIFPDSAAARQFLHYLQLYLVADFRQYDFGANANKAKYGSIRPPSYNLSKSTAPVALFAGLADALVSPYNTARLKRHLPNVVHSSLVPYLLFTHLDFVLSTDVVKLLYNKVISIMDRYVID